MEHKNKEQRHEERDHDAKRIVAIVVCVAMMLCFAVPAIFAGL